jgi:hypothetical protein
MQIQTTNGEAVEVDDSDRVLVENYRWGAYAAGGKPKYAVSVSCRDTGAKKVVMHRLIMGAKPGEIVDHVDGNGLNNRRSNLRLCSLAENSRNKTKKWGKHKFKGVWQNPGGTWVAIIKGKRVGKYLTEREAALAYDRAAEKEFGVFASLNFPESKERPESLSFRKRAENRRSGIWGRERIVSPKRARGRPRNFSAISAGQASFL